MALFGKGGKNPEPAPQPATVQPVPGRQVYCTVCSAYRQFSRCWRRLAYIKQCECCGQVFENVAAVYKRNLPACPRCGEFLEHPGFNYGLCDGCGSKYELVEGAKPGLLPNKKQRHNMNITGKTWSKD